MANGDATLSKRIKVRLGGPRHGLSSTVCDVRPGGSDAGFTSGRCQVVAAANRPWEAGLGRGR